MIAIGKLANNTELDKIFKEFTEALASKISEIKMKKRGMERYLQNIANKIDKMERDYEHLEQIEGEQLNEINQNRNLSNLIAYKKREAENDIVNKLKDISQDILKAHSVCGIKRTEFDELLINSKNRSKNYIQKILDEAILFTDDEVYSNHIVNKKTEIIKKQEKYSNDLFKLNTHLNELNEIAKTKELAATEHINTLTFFQYIFIFIYLLHIVLEGLYS